MKRSLMFLAIAAIAANSMSAQTPAAKFVDSARVEIDKSAITNDTARLGKAVVLLDRALIAFPNDAYLLHYRGYARYRQSINALAVSAAAASPFIEKGIADLERSGDKLKWPETWSLLYALNSFRLAVDPSLAPTLGPELGEIAGKAHQLGPNNPRVLYIEAVGMTRTPVEYGGGMDKARVLIDRALKAFETDKPAPLAPSWGLEAATAFKKQVDKGGV
jgi:hypothetical protein